MPSLHFLFIFIFLFFLYFVLYFSFFFSFTLCPYLSTPFLAFQQLQRQPTCVCSVRSRCCSAPFPSAVLTQFWLAVSTASSVPLLFSLSLPLRFSLSLCCLLPLLACTCVFFRSPHAFLCALESPRSTFLDVLGLPACLPILLPVCPSVSPSARPSLLLSGCLPGCCHHWLVHRHFAF